MNKKQCYACDKKYNIRLDRCPDCGSMHYVPTIEKPPIGLIPRKIHDENRIIDIMKAIMRYIEVRKEIPVEWIKEYNGLIRNEKEK